MKHMIVLYRSKYGYTKRYADWLASSLCCEAIDTRKIQTSQLDQYDTIVFGGGIYAGGISGISLITKNFERLKDRTLAVFTVGLADPKTSDIFAEVKRQFTPEMIQKIHFFHFRGGMDFPNLSLVDRLMMSMMKKMLQKKSESELTENDRELLKIWGTKIDFTDRHSLDSLLSFIQDVKD